MEHVTLLVNLYLVVKNSTTEIRRILYPRRNFDNLI